MVIRRRRKQRKEISITSCHHRVFKILGLIGGIVLRLDKVYAKLNNE